MGRFLSITECVVHDESGLVVFNSWNGLGMQALLALPKAPNCVHVQVHVICVGGCAPQNWRCIALYLAPETPKYRLLFASLSWRALCKPPRSEVAVQARVGTSHCTLPLKRPSTGCCLLRCRGEFCASRHAARSQFRQELEHRIVPCHETPEYRLLFASLSWRV